MVAVEEAIARVLHLEFQRTKVIVTAFVILLLFPELSSSRDDLVRNTNKGRVRGVRYHVPHIGKSVDTYLGIPFAKPPTKHLRFRHPEPIEQWTGIRNATKLPNSCYQLPDKTFGDFHGSDVWNPKTRVSEDCLYLNVWVPKTHRRMRKSAVMVWIYGGGFYSGTTTLNLYDGKILAALNEVIVVSISYRVGALGFLGLNHPSAPGNAGMFDQLMGLEWVQDNIKEFGGDPDNVTLFGESAGSASVSLHLLSPLSRNKFQRAIMQSGSATTPWATVTMEESKRRSYTLATQFLNCQETDDMQTISDCLRGIGPQTIVDQQWQIVRGISQFPFVPVIDGTFLIESPRKSLERKSFKKCPVLLGSNKNEGSWFIIYDLHDFISLDKKHMSRQNFLTSMNKLFFTYPQYPQENNEFGLEAILFHYSHVLDQDSVDKNLNALDNAVGDHLYMCPVNELAYAYASAGENVYMYYLTQRYSTSPWPSWMGVLHGDDIFFTFGELLKANMNYTEEEKQLSRRMMQYWTNFAKTGDPNRMPEGHSLGEWPSFTPNGQEYLELNAKYLDIADRSLAVGHGLRAKSCSFWRDYLPKLVHGTADIKEEERQWKLQFKEWSTNYIVDWKLQYERYLRNLDNCDKGDEDGGNL